MLREREKFAAGRRRVEVSALKRYMTGVALGKFGKFGKCHGRFPLFPSLEHPLSVPISPPLDRDTSSVLLVLLLWVLGHADVTGRNLPKVP